MFAQASFGGRAVAHLGILSLLLLTASGGRSEPPTPQLGLMVGILRSELVDRGDTLLDIAFEQRLGFEAVSRLNPDVDPWIPDEGSLVRLPTRYILPDVEREGLVLNIPEMRLYDFRGDGLPRVYAVAVGDAADPTPIGEFRIGVKRIDPIWNVPQSILAKRPELPPRVPPGPDNPLGDRWMTLGTSSYGIHGTNVRWSIGREATHGCVRLYADEMRQLFEDTPSGTPVRIVYQPYKWGRDGRDLYLEVHPDLYDRQPARLTSALTTPRKLGLLDAVDIERVWRAVDEALGIPVRVGTRSEPGAPEATSPHPS